MKDVTLILQRIQEGQSQASEALFSAVYEELRQLASSKMRAERVDHTLSATALVHEAYVRLVDTERIQEWNSRGHFFSAAAEAMRRILVEHARRKLTLKQGGAQHQRGQITEIAALPDDPDLLIDLNDGLVRLEEADPESAELVKLILFGGLSVAEAGRVMGMSRNVVYRHWDFVQRWFSLNA